MEGYGYSYPTAYPTLRPPEGEYPDHGDGFREYYGVGALNEDRGRRSRSKQRLRKGKKACSRSVSNTKSETRSKSRSKSRSRSVSHGNRSHSGNSQKEFNYKEPGFLDAFRVLYLTPSSNRQGASKYLATQKHQDRVHEILKSDGLGSKRWLFYPRQKNKIEPPEDEVVVTRDTCDRRVKVDGDFFRKYKRSKKIDQDAPIAKLKRWELILYKKLGFVQAV